MKEGARQEPGFRNKKIKSLAEYSCPPQPVELGDGPGSALRPALKQARGGSFGETRIFGLLHPLSLGFSSPGSLRLCGKERPGSRSLKG